VTLTGIPDGARVTVDANEVTLPAPDEPLLLDLGTRTLRVERAGFAPFERVLELAGGSSLEVAVTLVEAPPPSEAAPARLSVTSSGARDVIAIDGKVVGSGHFQGSLAAGEHRVHVTAEGKKPFDARIELSPGGQRSMEIALEDERKMPLWPWIAGGAALALGAAVGGYFLLRPDNSADEVPVGKLGTVQLKLGGAR
jgi:hypothetical protein